MLTSETAACPDSLIFSTISFFTSSTISSILAGWILPSLINFSKDNFAICLLIGSNPETMIVKGVSSIITSTPVARSRVLIFLPSLPITLPFISSLGRLTVEVVVSAVWAPEYFCIDWTIISLARFFSSSIPSCSISLIFFITSSSLSFSTLSRIISIAFSLLRSAIFSSLSNWSSFIFLISSLISITCFAFSCKTVFCFSISLDFFSKNSSFFTSLCSFLFTCLFLSISSFLASSKIFTALFFESSDISAALFFASVIILFTFPSAVSICFVARNCLPKYPIRDPALKATRIAINDCIVSIFYFS